MKRHRHLVSTTPTRHRCRGCKQTILRSLDGGLPVSVDPKPIPPGQELPILLEARTTYDLAGDRTLRRRDPSHIAAGTSGPLYAEHRCGPPR
jgi:hypothetical protein